MKIAVLGTGMVGETIATKLAQLQHDVMMGSRTPTNEKATAWAKKAGKHASHGTFEDAAKHGEIVFNCTKGSASLEALRSAGEANLKGKVLIDVSNHIDSSKGAPRIVVSPDDSLAEQIQRAFPDAKVVKTLNTVNAVAMVNPQALAGGEHTMFLSGNDGTAKGRASEILKGWFKWKHVIDLGDLTAARGQEAYLALWVRLYGTLKTPEFSVKVVTNA